jgi:hypothetical protein
LLIGFVLFLGFWYLAVEVWKLPRFREMPGITVVIKEWLSPNPTYGLSLYTEEYYQHIWVSTWRVARAFFLATVLGVPVGLFLGWSKKFKEYVFPVFETLRPIPILAWVPLAIVMFIATGIGGHLPDVPRIVLRDGSQYHARRRIDRRVVRARRELPGRQQIAGLPSCDRAGGAARSYSPGSRSRSESPGSRSSAAEMVSGQYGLGYVINTSYTMVRYPDDRDRHDHARRSRLCDQRAGAPSRAIT